MSEEVRIEDREGVRWIELNRPERKNSLTIEVNGRIIEGFQGAEAAGARVVVLTGAGGSFCSGLDLKQAMAVTGDGDIEERGRKYFIGLIQAVRRAPMPTVAAVDGTAVGYGCDLALACDLRLVSPRGKFGEIFIRRGLMSDGGASHTLPRLIGLGRALELLYTGEIVDAKEAVRIGLANRELPEDGFFDHVREFAAFIASGPPLAYRAIKSAMYKALDSDLDAALEVELQSQLKLLKTADFAEGVAAFLQKREPKFQGK